MLRVFEGLNIALIIRIGFPLKGSLKRSIVGFYSIGALTIRIGFMGMLYYNSNEAHPQ